MVVCFLVLVVRGQEVATSVAPVLGGVIKTPGGATLSWTVGELIVDPVRSGEILLTQGFQQPALEMSTGFSDPGFTHSISVFPNPVAMELTLETDFQDKLDFRLVGMDGKLVRQGVCRQQASVDVSTFPVGTYALYLIADGRMIQSELIIIK